MEVDLAASQSLKSFSRRPVSAPATGERSASIFLHFFGLLPVRFFSYSGFTGAIGNGAISFELLGQTVVLTDTNGFAGVSQFYG